MVMVAPIPHGLIAPEARGLESGTGDPLALLSARATTRR
jgi:hypothetical protein